MRFSVSVPVLSEQMTETQPAVSVAISLRMSAFSRASLIMLSASETATMVGSPSGTAATTSTMEVMKTSPTVSNERFPPSARRTIERTNTMTAATAPTAVTTFPSFASFCCSGEFISTFPESSPAMFPISVPPPTAVTAMTAVPCSANVPAYTMFRRSANGVEAFRTRSASFLTGALSPVSAASSARKSTQDKSLPSAAILSPPDSRTMSPTQSSSCGRYTVFPPRITLICTLSYIFASRRKARSLEPSITREMVTESTMENRIPAHSMKSPSPLFKNFPRFAPKVIARLNTRIRSMGSVRLSKIRENRDFFFFFSSVFLPYRSRLALRAASDSPSFSAVCRARKTDSFSKE